MVKRSYTSKKAVPRPGFVVEAADVSPVARHLDQAETNSVPCFSAFKGALQALDYFRHSVLRLDNNAGKSGYVGHSGSVHEIKNLATGI
jgi:hypothetical protein